MTDLLLTHGYFLADDEKERQIMKPYPPLGLLYLSAYLKRAGFSVEVFDSTFRERAELAARFAATPGGVVGIYTNLMTRPSVLEIVRAARRHGWTVILGGPESANYTEEYLVGRHVIVIGERAPSRLARDRRLAHTVTRSAASRFATSWRHVRPPTREIQPRHCRGRIAKPSTISSTWTPGRLTTAPAASTSSPRAAAPTSATGARMPCTASRTGDAARCRWRMNCSG
jgi:hypothetical protein